MHFNKIRADKEKMRIVRNHEETLMQIKVDHFVKQYGSNLQLMPPDLRMHVKGQTQSIGHHNAHKVDDFIV